MMRDFIARCTRPISKADVYGLLCLVSAGFTAWSADLPWYSIGGVVMTIAFLIDWFESAIERALAPTTINAEEGGN